MTDAIIKILAIMLVGCIFVFYLLPLVVLLGVSTLGMFPVWALAVFGSLAVLIYWVFLTMLVIAMLR